MGETRDCHRETVTAHEDPMYRAAGSVQRGPLSMRVQGVVATILKGALATRVRVASYRSSRLDVHMPYMRPKLTLTRGSHPLVSSLLCSLPYHSEAIHIALVCSPAVESLPQR